MERRGDARLSISRDSKASAFWRWQERFAEEGVDGPLRDKTSPARVAPLGQEVIDRAVTLPATEPPHEAPPWTGAAMARPGRTHGQSSTAD